MVHADASCLGPDLDDFIAAATCDLPGMPGLPGIPNERRLCGPLDESQALTHATSHFGVQPNGLDRLRHSLTPAS
jgi:hypothetical protein